MAVDLISFWKNTAFESHPSHPIPFHALDAGSAQNLAFAVHSMAIEILIMRDVVSPGIFEGSFFEAYKYVYL